MQMNVLGWAHKKGEFEGRGYDYVVIHAIGRLKQSDDVRGSAGVEIRGEPQLVEKLKKIDFVGVVRLDVETELSANGKGQYSEMAVNITLLPPK